MHANNVVFSSPEPSGSQGELKVYPCSGVRCGRRRCRRRRQQFQKASPLKPRDQSTPNFSRSLFGQEERKFI